MSSTPPHETPRPSSPPSPEHPPSRHRGRRILAIALVAVGALLLLVFFAGGFLLGTEAGARFLFARLGTLLPGSFDVARVEGPIRGPLTLSGVVYKREGMEVRIDRAALAWRPGALLAKRLDVERLEAQGIHIVKTPAPKTNEPFKLPDLNLRFNILVRDAEVRNLTLTAAEAAAGGSANAAAPPPAGQSAPLVIDRIDLATTETAGIFHVDHLTVRSPQVNADVSGTLDPRGDYPVDLAARWSVQPQGMAPVAGHGTLSGTLVNLKVAQAVETPFPVTLDALLSTPFETLGFDARLAFRDVDPHRLKMTLPALTAAGSVTAKGTLDDLTSAGTVEVAVPASLAPTGPVAISYRLARQGGETYRLDAADVTFPGTPTALHAAGRFTLTADQKLSADSTLSWRSLAWPPRGKASFASAAGQAHVVVAGALQAFAGTLGLRADVTPPGLPSLQLAADLRLARQGDTFRLERGDVTLPGTPARIAAQGAVTRRGKAMDVNARASWANVQWPLRGRPLARSAAGEAEVAGTLDAYRARVAADLEGAPGGTIPPGRWTIAGTGDQRSFRIASLGGGVLGGHLAGSGSVAWSPRLAWDLALSGQGLNPGALRPDFPGSLTLAAKTRGTMEPAGPTGSVDLERLGGTLRGQPIGGSAAVRLAGKRYDLPHVDLTWGGAKLAASGTVGDRLSLGYRVSVPNLALALPQAGGAIAASGRVSGALRAPRLVTDATLDGLRYGALAPGSGGGTSVGSAKISGDVDLAPGGAIRLDVQASRLASGGKTVSGVTLAARGTAERHTLSVHLDDPSVLPGGRMDLAVAGGLAGGLGPQASWRGDITRLDLADQQTGNWSLERPAPLAVSKSDLRLDGFCWHSGGARLCAQASRVKAGPWSAQATLAALQLRLLQPSLPAGASIRGDLNGTVAARGGANGLDQATVDLSPGPGDLVYPAEEGKTVTVHFERGSIHAVTGARGGQATAELRLTNLGDLSGQVELPRLGPGVTVASQPLAGRVGLHLSDLGFAAAFSPELRSVGGNLQADFRLGGTFGAPRLSGQAKLAGGRAKVPEYGLDVRDLTLTAAGNGSGVLQVTGGARSGKGTISIAGQASLEPSAATPVHLKITGSRFQVAGTEQMNVLVTPNLDFTLENRLAKLIGQVDVPYARINIEKLQKKNNPVPVSKDVVFVGGTVPGPAEAKPPTAVQARVRIVLGDDIDIKALGLAGKPAGALLAVEQPGKAPTATGEITINEGTFKAYGQDLTIERGRLIFAGGPIDNPGVDLRAYRKADDGTTAGIEATGKLKSPEVTLWSDPVMTESEALAYLLLGHPLNQATPQEGSLLANAATSLELKGGNLIAKRLASRFGLESATIESTGGLDQAALVLGKYLSPRLYVSYGIGLFQSINTFRIRYIINKHYTLQADSGQTTQGTGADILYTREH